MYEGKIPFDQHGNPVPYAIGGPENQSTLSKFVWKDNKVFRATLTFERFERGFSAAHAIYVKADDPSWQVTMFLSDLKDVIKAGRSPLSLRGDYVFVKRGTNYGIQLIDP